MLRSTLLLATCLALLVACAPAADTEEAPEAAPQEGVISGEDFESGETSWTEEVSDEPDEEAEQDEPSSPADGS